ncbi:GGDEF domain-containing protein [Deinococcus altitudinis]|uniref:GGDEF domain-containing protein n=1 Tax=Deinococcus altitudinis TaxID=468914 RepID=UPI0038923794
MSASFRPSSRPAEQVASSLEYGRKLILQLVCGGYLLYLLAHRIALPGVQFNALGPELMTGYICTVTMLLSVIPTVHFKLLTYLLTLIFLPYSTFLLLASLKQQLLPLGYLAWSPMIVVLCFSILGWRLGGLVTGLLLLGLFTGLALFQPATPQQVNAWLAQGVMMVILTLVCALIARFVESRLQSGHEVSVQLAAARMDGLTGLMGRTASELYLNEGLHLAQRSQLPLSLLICDLDNFKAVNDRYGHPVGDAVLKAAARRLRRQTGGNGKVGRWGGEEFVVILPGVAKPEAMALAERMRKAIESNALAGLAVTASFGVAAYRTSDNMAELFERADQRLYEAKNSGRNMIRG